MFVLVIYNIKIKFINYVRGKKSLKEFRILNLKTNKFKQAVGFQFFKIIRNIFSSVLYL